MCSCSTVLITVRVVDNRIVALDALRESFFAILLFVVFLGFARIFYRLTALIVAQLLLLMF